MRVFVTVTSRRNGSYLVGHLERNLISVPSLTDQILLSSPPFNTSGVSWSDNVSTVLISYAFRAYWIRSVLGLGFSAFPMS